MSEPEWTKQIPNWAICDWFYILYVVNVVVLVMLLLSVIYLALSSSMPKIMRLTSIFMIVSQMVLSGTTTLFYYLMCDRTLKP